ncbi:NTP transferase domain-containing protein [Epidermidibacterium keratini]|uniref:NTP transferase domain-containing protein n=1 Tax=Epidermidibacterium keratini TaxID=1891644 RepID=A0A7L4YR46_9ACTN|nr:molybdenum cofactor guanylyltransferase [Epidermidibacterium keratini]QHC01413.1 NTP transferase domain-containing protein [Epidermidibacterium keratini]
MTTGAIVLTGGRARRLSGAAKAQLEIDGRSLLQRILDAIGSSPVVVVGPADDTVGVTFVREDPPYAGPLAAIATGVETLADDVTQVLVLAADMPFLDGPTLHRLGAGLDSAPAAVLVSGGRRHWLTAAWDRSALTAALAALPALADAPVRLIYDGICVAEVAADERTAFDIDTPEDLQRAKEWT